MCGERVGVCIIHTINTAVNSLIQNVTRLKGSKLYVLAARTH